MSPPLPVIDSERLRADSERLDRALAAVVRAAALLGSTLEAPPDLGPASAADSWTVAVESRVRDLAEMAEVLEHARNVLATSAATVDGAGAKYARAWTGRRRSYWLDQLVGIVALAAEQFATMTAVEVAELPEAGPAPSGVLDDGHVLADGIIRAESR